AGGTVFTSDSQIACGPSCTAAFDEGSSVVLTAFPNPSAGAQFLGWEGDCTGTQLACTVTVHHDVSVRANFGMPVHVAVNGPGRIVSSPSGLDCTTTCDTLFPFGSSVTLTAEPGPGAAFSGWYAGPCSGSVNPSCTIDASYNWFILTGGVPI